MNNTDVLSLTEHRLMQLINGSLHSWTTEALLSVIRPSIRLEHSDDARSRSYLGGRPTMPSSFSWPRRGRSPLSLIATLDFRDFAHVQTDFDLPTSGVLQVFYEVQAPIAFGFGAQRRDSWKIIYTEAPGEVCTPRGDNVTSLSSRREELARDLPSELHEVSTPTGAIEYARVPIRPVQILTGPIWIEPNDSRFDSDERDTIAEIARILPHVQQVNAPWHQLGGWPTLIQPGSFGSDALLPDGPPHDWNATGMSRPQHEQLPKGEDWFLLLQIDSDELPGWSWVDAGVLYFSITRSDLEAQRFDRAILTMQCC